MEQISHLAEHVFAEDSDITDQDIDTILAKEKQDPFNEESMGGNRTNLAAPSATPALPLSPDRETFGQQPRDVETAQG